MKKSPYRQAMILELLADGQPRSGLEIGQALLGWWVSRILPDIYELEADGYVQGEWEDGPYPRRRLYRLKPRA